MSDLSEQETSPNTFGTPFGTVPEIPAEIQKIPESLRLPDELNKHSSTLFKIIPDAQRVLERLSSAEISSLSKLLELYDSQSKILTELTKTTDIFSGRVALLEVINWKTYEGKIDFIKSRLKSPLIPEVQIDLMSKYLLSELTKTIALVTRDFSDASIPDASYDGVTEEVRKIVEGYQIRLNGAEKREAEVTLASVRTGSTNLEDNYWELELPSFTQLPTAEVTNELNYELFRGLQKVLTNEDGKFTRILPVMLELSRLENLIVGVNIDSDETGFLPAFKKLLSEATAKISVTFQERTGYIPQSLDSTARTLDKGSGYSETILYLSTNQDALKVANDAFFRTLFLFLTPTIIARLEEEKTFVEGVIEVAKGDIKTMLSPKPETKIESNDAERKSLEEMKDHINSFIDLLQEGGDFSSMPNLTKITIAENDPEDLKKLKNEINNLIFLLNRIATPKADAPKPIVTNQVMPAVELTLPPTPEGILPSSTDLTVENKRVDELTEEELKALKDSRENFFKMEGSTLRTSMDIGESLSLGRYTLLRPDNAETVNMKYFTQTELITHVVLETKADRLILGHMGKFQTAVYTKDPYSESYILASMLSGRDKFSVDVSNNQPVALRLGNTSSENNPSSLHVLILKGKIYPISYKIFKAFTASKSTQVQNQIIDIITA